MIHVLGDIHGHADRFAELLAGAGLIDDAHAWSGGDATLVLMGDFTDRGPRGLEAIALAMRLEVEAAFAGGRVVSVLGNHDLLLIAAKRFPEAVTDYGETFHEHWLDSGGEPRDLEGVGREQLTWLASRPAAVLLDDTLFVHGDCSLYLDCGNSVDEVNRRFASIARDDDPDPLDALLDGFSEHGGFEEAGRALAESLLRRFGGRRVVHGHTPISAVSGEEAGEVCDARVYHDGLCVNVDHGLYLGGPGFVLDLDTVAPPPRPAGERSRARRLLG